jgi:membrane protein YdbS with pleckstrin-like domain
MTDTTCSEDHQMRKIGVVKGNAYFLNFIGLLIFAFFYFFVYRLLWNVNAPEWVYSGRGFLIVAVFIIMLILIHELIHAVSAFAFGKSKGLSIKLGVLVFQCRLKSYLTRNQYMSYAVAPALLLSVCGVASYYVSDSISIKFFSALLFLAGITSGGGDFWFVAKVRRYPRDCLILDNGAEIEILLEESPSS